MSSVALPQPPKVVKKEDNRAVIEISGLSPGYGVTIGNSLRRVLYSSIPGAAITSAKIEKVSHEFSTVEGVLEDVLEIGMNLKQVKLVLHGDEPQTMKLKVKGKKEVKAKDIETPSQVEIVNKDAHIATLTTAKASLEVEMTVEPGLGYVQAKEEGAKKREIGVLSLDAVFSPIMEVNYDVENMRVGDRTDYNRLTLDIKTDGTITPEEAFSQAAKTLVDHFTLMTSSVGEEEVKEKKKSTKKSSAAKSSKTKKSQAKKK